MSLGEPQACKNKEQHDDCSAEQPSARDARFHLVLQLLQFGNYSRSSLVAGVSILMNCSINNGFELRWNPRIQIPDRTRNLVEDRLMKHWSAVSSEGTLPGCHFVENQAKGKKICPCV